MLLAIEIISGIFFFSNLCAIATSKTSQVVPWLAIFVLSTWNECLPLAIIAIVLFLIIFVRYTLKK